MHVGHNPLVEDALLCLVVENNGPEGATLPVEAWVLENGAHFAHKLLLCRRGETVRLLWQLLHLEGEGSRGVLEEVRKV